MYNLHKHSLHLWNYCNEIRQNLWVKGSDVFTFASGFDKKCGLPGLEMKEF